MPKAMERALKKEAKKKFGSSTSEEARALIYGTMRNAGWKSKREKKLRAFGKQS